MIGTILPVIRCTGRVDLRNALKTIARERPAIAEIEWVHDARKSSDDLPPIVVPEGTILRLTHYTGLPQLVLASGHLVFEAWSSWGNALTVTGGHAHVLTDGRNRKVTIRLEPLDGQPAVVTTTADEIESGSRVRLWGPTAPADNRPIVVPVNDRGEPIEWQN